LARARPGRAPRARLASRAVGQADVLPHSL
jgi:hypothetical protein